MPYIQVVWQLGGKLLSILSDLIVEVDVRGVLQQVVLPVHSCHHFGMAVASADSHDSRKGLY